MLDTPMLSLQRMLYTMLRPHLGVPLPEPPDLRLNQDLLIPTEDILDYSFHTGNRGDEGPQYTIS